MVGLLFAFWMDLFNCPIAQFLVILLRVDSDFNCKMLCSQISFRNL